MPASTPYQIKEMLNRAKANRKRWEGLWQDCYDYTQPHRKSAPAQLGSDEVKKANPLYDSTACDSVEQLAASLLAELVPPWSEWFGFKPGLESRLYQDSNQDLVQVGGIVRSYLERSNMTVELHQAFLDLVTVGTSCILVEQAPPGSASPVKFSTIPASELYLEGENGGAIRRVFRSYACDIDILREKFPQKLQLIERESGQTENKLQTVTLTEMFEIQPWRCDYFAICDFPNGNCFLLHEGHYNETPVLVFRWSKSPGEVFGRSPVMNALADIKTANKVVELVLKNASISVTGIWLAEDDGILNPKTIRLTPGTIIPKAVGSKGLTPLEAPGRFDVSQLILNDLRRKIRHTLLVDRLGALNDRKMTATEVLQRSAEMSRLLGAVFGRLQSELIVPLLTRTVRILQNRGLVPPFGFGSDQVEIDYRSPLARAQARDDVANTMMWLDAIQNLGQSANELIEPERIVRHLAESLGIPLDLIKSQPSEIDLIATALSGVSL